ncbi:MAG: BTAD domain-containing putative transcriptional regulator [Chloroflexota bacterium]
MTLQLTLFGTLQLQSGTEQPLRFPTSKARALLTYLVVENGRSHSRSSLANMLWPGTTEKRGRQNLSQTLRRLRLTITQAEPDIWSTLFQTTAQDITGLRGSDLACDVLTFQQLLAQAAEHQHDALEACPVCLARLRQAVALYKGDFLVDFSLPDALLFEEWADLRRGQLRRQALEALDTLMVVALDKGDMATLEQYAQQQLRIEPWRERGWRYLLIALIQSNQHNEAIKRYHHYRQSLQQELGIQPSFMLRQLINEVRDELGAEVSKTPRRSETWHSFISSVQQREAATVQDFAVSQAGDRLLVVGADGTLQLWDASREEATEAAGEVPPELAGEQTAVTCVALSPNGRLAAAGTSEGRIICWRVADGTIVQDWIAHAGVVRRLTFLPNSDGLLSVGTNGVLRLWHPPS